jgi:hypothetical protein
MIEDQNRPEPVRRTGFISGQITVDQLLAFGFGCVFVTALLVLAVAIPNPTNFTLFIFRVVLALAAAGVGAVLPGLLQIDLPAVRAGGALALAAMVYLINPPALITESVQQKVERELHRA